MKNPLLIISLGIMLAACSPSAENSASEPQEVKTVTAEKVESEMATGFNQELAEKLGADEYGMRSYIFATLLTGPNDAVITDEAERAELFAGHFSTMKRMAENGDLVLAGPFMEAGQKRGLFILNVKTIAEAEALVKTDPSIAAGIFKVEFDKYYGSAALMDVNRVHETIQKTKM